MLLHAGRRRFELPMGVDSVHNYYEHMVLEEIAQHSSRAQEDMDFLADVACVALNRLPPRYIRHDVDMTFFMSQVELQEMNNKVHQAVMEAIDYVASREREPDELVAEDTTTEITTDDRPSNAPSNVPSDNNTDSSNTPTVGD